MLFRGGLDYIISVTDDLIMDPVLTATTNAQTGARSCHINTMLFTQKSSDSKTLDVDFLRPKWTFQELCFWGAWHKILVSTILWALHIILLPTSFNCRNMHWLFSSHNNQQHPNLWTVLQCSELQCIKLLLLIAIYLTFAPKGLTIHDLGCRRTTALKNITNPTTRICNSSPRHKKSGSLCVPPRMDADTCCWHKNEDDRMMMMRRIHLRRSHSLSDRSEGGEGSERPSAGSRGPDTFSFYIVCRGWKRALVGGGGIDRPIASRKMCRLAAKISDRSKNLCKIRRS